MWVRASMFQKEQKFDWYIGYARGMVVNWDWEGQRWSCVVCRVDLRSVL